LRAVERITAWGNENITAKNRSTFEITREHHLTKRGDCIIAVNSSKGASDLDLDFRRLAVRDDAEISVTIEAGGLMDTAFGRGGPDLTFEHSADLVARRSSYQCSRTFMIKSNKAASDLSHELIQVIKNSNQKILITLIAEV